MFEIYKTIVLELTNLTPEELDYTFSEQEINAFIAEEKAQPEQIKLDILDALGYPSKPHKPLHSDMKAIMNEFEIDELIPGTINEYDTINCLCEICKCPKAYINFLFHTRDLKKQAIIALCCQCGTRYLIFQRVID